MKLLTRSALAVLLASASTAFAESDASDSSTCNKACAFASASGGSTCPVTAGLSKLPKMTFAVGEESLCCSEMAKAKAAETGKSVEYVVGDEKFDSESKAFTALVSHTEKFVNDFATPYTCSSSGTTTIAGQACECSVKAGEITAKVKAAMAKVAMVYKVGDKECSCPVEAAALEKSLGATKTFVVDGGEPTTCDATARLSLARAKYKAALVAMNAETGKALEESDSQPVSNE